MTSRNHINPTTADGVAQRGHMMVNATLLDVHGFSVRLDAVRAGRMAVLVLYRGTWCPHCNLAMRTYQRDLVPELDRRGVAPIAISPQRPDGSLSMQEKNDLTFTVSSDPGNQVAAALGVLTQPGDETRRALRTRRTILTKVNGGGTEAVPMPTVAIVDPAGVVRWVDVHADYIAAVTALGA